jgi:hypothetical protein
MELETDDKGNVSFLPVLTWGVWVVQGRTVGLAADYYANAEDAAALKVTRIQLHLDPEPAATFGRALVSHAQKVLSLPDGAGR